MDVVSSAVLPSDEQRAAVPTSIFAPRLRTASAGILILMTLIAFEAMAVAPALPTAAKALHGLSAYGWAFTGFLLANVVGMVLSGQLSDARGPRPPLVAGLACFLAGLVVAGSATTMVQLVASRAVQGLGSGLLITALYVVIGESYPEQLRPKVFTATSAAWLLPSLMGPVVAGAITQHLGWRWVFLGLLPFVAIGTLLMASVLRRMPPRRRTPGAALLAQPRRLGSAVVVAVGIAAFESVAQHPSPAWVVLALAGLAAVGWGMRPLVPPGTFRVRPGVAAPVALRGLLACAFVGGETTVPLLLQQQHGLSPLLAGLPLTCAGVTWSIGSWWQARERGSDPARRRARLVRAGFALVAVALATVALTALPAMPWELIFAGWACGGAGCGLTMSSVGVLLLAATTDAERGRDSAALQLSDTTCSALTTGLAGILVAAAARSAIGYTAAFIAANAVFFAIALLGLAVSGRARRDVGSAPAQYVS